MSLENIYWADIAKGLLQTLAMVSGALFLTVLIGLPLGVLLFLTGRKQMFDQPLFYGALSVVIGVIRSLPFIILLIVLMPVTVLVTGTSLGTRGVIFPLVVGTAPFFARLVETALREVDRGIIEASEAMGATTAQTMIRAVLPEALPSLVAAVTVTAIVLVDYTAMSGAIGGGGLGDLAIRYGYQRFQTEIMLVCVGILVILVQLIQVSGNHLVIRFSRK
ncbi:methionine ABC transporter permease [Phyllobacterium zundukense]|uniref:Metal ABC transporter permease n=1 Tax=Phyllobacterium zundukense TaxID=1867719 RepID=A0A2N9VY96_9HYPH|nr:methionine ABC transporter permease [Phyllobacterium zundukense]ATU95059.1 metal ABC transporter permease [Phyllobacterium zundukense]PIO44464.1 metal ABC transporter permease [Phyllobacterium zundukense]